MSNSPTYVPHAVPFEKHSWISSDMAFIWAIAAADSVPDPRLPRRAGRFSACHSLHSRARVLATGGADGPHSPRVRRTPLCPLAFRNRSGDRAAIPFQWQPAHHQLSRAKPLDGLRVLRHPGHQARSTALLGLVRRRRRYRTRGEIHDGPLRVRHRARTSPHRTAPLPARQMALDRRRRGIPDFPAEPSLEYSRSLAVPRAHAQYPRRRPRRGARSRPVLHSTDHPATSAHRAHLARRTRRLFRLRPPEAVPRARLELSGLLRNTLRVARKKLLPRACVSRVAGGGSRRD